MSALWPKYGTTHRRRADRKPLFPDDGRPAWRVRVSAASPKGGCIGIPYARKQDCERAIEALLELPIDWEQTDMDALYRDVVAFGMDNLREAMTSCLAW